MISFKNKIQILKLLKTNNLDLSEITKYIDWLQCKSLTAPVLDRLIEKLIEMDAQITAMYESMPDEDWDNIVSSYDTPLENQSYAVVRNNIKDFVTAYMAVEKVIREIDLNILFNVLSKITLCKTTSIQYLFVSVAITRPNPVLYYFLDNIKDKPTVFVPYFVSFVSRIEISCSAAIQKYIDWVKKLKKGKNIVYILATQGLMYLCCFKEEFFDSCKDIFDHIFSGRIYIYMNSHVVEKFCSLFPYKFKLFKSLEHSSLYSFPFDESILDPIYELYEDYYVEFE